MKNSPRRLLALSVLLLLADASAYASNGSNKIETTTSSRSAKRLGAYLGIGEPAPTLIGINLAYNVTDFLRASAGYGSLSVATSLSFGSDGSLTANEASAKTFGVGVRGLVPGWSVSPTVGLHFAHVSYSGAGGLTVGGFQESGSHIYGSLGVDWQASFGLNLSAGYNYSFKSGIGGSAYLNAGWFVDWLG